MPTKPQLEKQVEQLTKAQDALERSLAPVVAADVGFDATLTMTPTSVRKLVGQVMPKENPYPVDVAGESKDFSITLTVVGLEVFASIPGFEPFYLEKDSE